MTERRGGFTLIEVIVALALAGVSFLVLSEAFAGTLRALADNRVQADIQGQLRFVRNQILLEPDRDEFERGGEVTTLELGEVVWEAEIEETEVPSLFRTTLLISYIDPVTEEEVELTEVLRVLRPTWADPVENSVLLEDFRERIQDRRLGLEDEF